MCHAVREGFESMLAGVLLPVLVAVSIVTSTVTGLVIAKLETGRTSVTIVVKEATSRETAKTVLRKPADRGPLQREEYVMLITKRGGQDQEVLVMKLPLQKETLQEREVLLQAETG